MSVTRIPSLDDAEFLNSSCCNSARNNLCPLKVFVRVRPFIRRELELNRKGESGSVIEMSDPQATTITTAVALSDNFTQRESFTFERCFNAAMRGEQAIESGTTLSTPTDQGSVYAHVGLPVLRNVLDGYNGCILAYGQTGSGKTFTMMGPPSVLGTGCGSGTKSKSKRHDDFANSEKQPLEGIIPRLVRDLFEALQRKHASDETHSFKLELEYYEIYKEKVLDLLSPTSEDALRVRNHSERGPYVEGLTRKQIASGEQVFKWIKRGNIERHTGTTKMNDRSSRSHAVLSLHLVQMRLTGEENKGMGACLTSKLHLVDLAGSERAAASGAVGLQLQEANKINTSLTTLGRVIDALAEISQGKSAFCPYRDSTLTWLLMDSIGGNSKTTLIATVSPHFVNYEETCQTLRYASRAKQIVTKVTVNEDPQIIRIRQLTSEVKRLQALTQGGEGRDEYIDQLKRHASFLEEQLVEKDLGIAQLKADLSHAQATCTTPAAVSQPARVVEVEKKPRRSTSSSHSSSSRELEALRKELKKQESLVSSLQKELRASALRERDFLKELSHYRESKKDQIHRAVVAEREEWEGEVAALQAKLRETSSLQNEQRLEVERLKKRERERWSTDLKTRVSSAVRQVTIDAAQTSAALKGGTVEMLEDLHLIRSGTTSSDTIDGRELAMACNGLAEALRAAKTANTLLLNTHAADIRDYIQTLEQREWTVLSRTAAALLEQAKNTTSRKSTLYPRSCALHSAAPTPSSTAMRRKDTTSPKRYLTPRSERRTTPRVAQSARRPEVPVESFSPAYERYAALKSARGVERRSSAPAKQHVSSASKTKRDATSRSAHRTGAVSPRKTRGRTTTPRDASASKTPRPRGKRDGSSPVARPPSARRTVSTTVQEAPSLVQLQKEFEGCRERAESQHLADVAAIQQLTEELQRVKSERERAALMSNEGPHAHSDGSGKDVAELERKLQHAQNQISMLRRIYSARDRIYEEINRIGVNPACFTEAILSIEAAARSQWEEEERLHRANIVVQLELHQHYSLMQEIHKDTELANDQLIGEMRRELDSAHAEQDKLMKANQVVLKKVHYVKEKLEVEIAEKERLETLVAALSSDVDQREAELAKALSARTSELERLQNVHEQVLEELTRIAEDKSALEDQNETLQKNVSELNNQLDAAHAATEELMKANQIVLKKVHFTKDLLQKEIEKNAATGQWIAEQQRSADQKSAGLEQLLTTKEAELKRLQDIHEKTIEELTTTTEDKSAIERQNVALQKDINDLTEELNASQAASEELMKANQTLLKKIHVTKDLLEKEVAQNAAAAESIAELKSNLKSLSENREEMAAVGDVQLKENEMLRREVQSLKDELRDTGASWDKRLRDEESKNQCVISRMKKELDLQASKIASERVSLEAVRSSADQKAADQEQLLATKEAELKRLQDIHEKTIEELTTITEEKSAIENQSAAFQKDINDLTEELNASQAASEELMKANQTLLKKIHFTKDLLEKEVAQNAAAAESIIELQSNADQQKAHLEQLLTEKETELKQLQDIHGQAVEELRVVAEEKAVQETLLSQRVTTLEGQNKTLCEKTTELETLINHLREVIAMKDSEIQEFEELKCMQAHLDSLEEQSSGAPGGSVAKSFSSHLTSLLNGKLFRNKSQKDDRAHAEGKDEDSMGQSFSSATTEMSIHKMLAAKVECGTGFRRGTVPQRMRRTNTPSAAVGKLRTTRKTPKRVNRRTTPSNPRDAGEEPAPRVPVLQRRLPNVMDAEKRSRSKVGGRISNKRGMSTEQVFS